MAKVATELGSDAPMREGMKGLIAAMKDRKPAPREADIGNDSTLPPDEIKAGGDDPLAKAPWSAVASVVDQVAARLERGALVGRYIVLQELGAGGMGIVYAAYDPELDRKVAIKLLLRDSDGQSASTRLLREAQALAKLSHPNVVAIHDVGTVGTQVWLAMEFVQGRTLRTWLETPRRWHEVLAVMRSAGEGLAAAHAAGILHRDLKPDNVMVGDDGRVRVMDFGLARGQARTTVDGDEEPMAARHDALEIFITRPGAMVGTHAYMPAEQFDGKELTPAADVFAFCVTTWEALYGERPFAGETWMAIMANVAGGLLRPPPKDRPVPKWLRHACERGLAVDPAQRWPSIQALLDVLTHGRARSRVRHGLAGLGVLALLGAGAELYRRVDLAHRTAACETKGDEIESAWNPTREQALRAGMLATGVSYAATTADKTVPWLEQHADQWREARVEACLDADVHGTWNAATLDRSLWCLDDRRAELALLVDILISADARAVTQAVSQAAGLSSPTRCRDEASLEDPPPQHEREAIGKIRAQGLQAFSLQQAGRFDEGLVLAEDALERAQALSWPPLASSARYQVGSLVLLKGDYARAEQVLEQAYFESVGGVAPSVAFLAANDLIDTVGVQLARPSDGRRWGRHAAVALSQVPDREGQRRASWLAMLGDLEFGAADHPRALALYQEALDLREAALGPDHPKVAVSLARLAATRQTMGALVEARALHERVLAILTAAYGSGHPDLPGAIVNIAAIEFASGNYPEARRRMEQAIAIQERTLDPDHPSLLESYGNLAKLYIVMGDLDRAKQELEKLVAITERTLGPSHPILAERLTDLGTVHVDSEAPAEAKILYERALSIYESGRIDNGNVAIVLANLGEVHAKLGDHSQSQAFHRRALIVAERVLGAEHPQVATILGFLARAHTALREHDQAQALFARALDINENVLGPDHPDLVPILLGMADLALARQRPADALEVAQRAVTLSDKDGIRPDQLAHARFVLAQALWEAPADTGRDRSRAITLAEQARDVYGSLGKGYEARVAEAGAWLGERYGEGQHSPATRGSH